MSSFQLVENKIYEANFFLGKIKECNDNLYFDECNYYLSAFTSSSRSITFALQKCMKKIDGFIDWYDKFRRQLSESDVARFFIDARNKSEKEGITLVGCGESSHGLFFRDIYFEGTISDLEYRQYLLGIIGSYLTGKSVKNNINYLYEKNVYQLCKEYFTILLKVILECFIQYGDIIDPSKYYTLSSMKRQSKCIEDYEEELGYPRGWTECIHDDKKRIRILREMTPSSDVFNILVEYLGSETVQSYLNTIGQ